LWRDELVAIYARKSKHARIYFKYGCHEVDPRFWVRLRHLASFGCIVKFGPYGGMPTLKINLSRRAALEVASEILKIIQFVATFWWRLLPNAAAFVRSLHNQPNCR